MKATTYKGFLGKPVKVLVPYKAKTMLPKYSDEELTEIAATVGLSLVQLKDVQRAAYATYCAIGHDLAECNGGKAMSREVVVETSLDANYINMYGWRSGGVTGPPAEIEVWLREKVSTYALEVVYAAVATAFPFPRYE